MPLIKKLQIGAIVAYTQKTDSDLEQESPNINPAMITQVYDGDLVDLVVFHSNGSYHIQKVPHGDDRGYWHFLRLLDDANG